MVGKLLLASLLRHMNARNSQQYLKRLLSVFAAAALFTLPLSGQVDVSTAVPAKVGQKLEDLMQRVLDRFLQGKSGDDQTREILKKMTNNQPTVDPILDPIVHIPTPRGIPSGTVFRPTEPAVFLNYLLQQAKLHPLAFAALSDPTVAAAAERCNEPAAALVQLRDEMDKNVVLANIRLIQDRAKALATISDYVSSCLTPSDKLPVSIRAALDASVGVLALEGPQYRCSVTRLSETEVITARHCTFDSESDTRIAPQRLRVFLLSSPRQSLDVIAYRDAPTADPDHFEDHDLDDYVVLTVSMPAKAYQPLATGMPSLLDRLVVYGYQPIVEVRDELRRQTLAPSGEVADVGLWENRMFADYSMTCMVGYLTHQNDCVLHGCQTEAELSGAGLFKLTGTGPIFVGIHTRQNSMHDPRPCVQLMEVEAPNCGLTLQAMASVISDAAINK